MMGGWPRQAASAAVERRARGVVWTNQANLAAFTVASDDSVTYAANDVVILAAQTTATERGPWVVGTVAAGAAPLTRPSWWAAGASIASGTVIEVGGPGPIFGGSSWKVMRTSACTVDTHDPELYPRMYRDTLTLVNGGVIHGAGGDAAPVFLYAAAGPVLFNVKTANGNAVTTSMLIVASAAGVAGTGSISVNAVSTAGVQNAADNSVYHVVIPNW